MGDKKKEHSKKDHDKKEQDTKDEREIAWKEGVREENEWEERHGQLSQTGQHGAKKDNHDEMRAIFQIQIANLKHKFERPVDQVYIPLRGPVLETQLAEYDIEQFEKAFQNAPNKSMDLKMFEANLKQIADVTMDPNDLKTLFLKMDADKNNLVTWNEFLSYLLLEMKDKDGSDDKEELVPPLSGYPRVLKTHHRLPIIKITFLPIVQPDRSVSFFKGRYVTASRDGMIHCWTLDFEMEGTYYSECPDLRVRSTWVTDLVTLPDVNVICTSSTERDLRFYDCTGNKFDLRIMINRLDYPVTCMWYNFYQDINRYSKLITGTMSGSVIVFSFSTINKGPFFFTPGKYLTTMRYENVFKGELGMKVTEYNGIHAEWVKQVGYYPNMNSFLSCAAVSNNSLIMVDSQDNQCAFNVPKGINCFTIEETMHVLVTGCVDCSVRVWNVFVPTKPSCVFVGHHAPIVAVITQDAGTRVYSLAKDKCIKVWDVPAQTCVQTYIGMPQEVGSSGLSTLYNPCNRNLIVASHKMALLVLGVVVDQQRSDGFTHTMAVVRALYNPLFKCVVTVGLDSLIMVWDPWEGKRMVLIRNAHTRNYYGDPTAVEITAACFDPGYQQLLTGARDGTLKVWNFNTATCTRTMNIELYCEVTEVIWLHGRILAVGWNRHVTEFADDSLVVEPKMWETRHTDDVLCAAACGEQAIVTSSYTGELIMWRLETGQAYRRYNVAYPRSRIILTYKTEMKYRQRGSILTAGTVEGVSTSREKSEKIRSKYDFRKKGEDLFIDPSMPKGKPGEMKDIVLTYPISSKKKDPSSQSVVRRMSLVGPSAMDARRVSVADARRASRADARRASTAGARRGSAADALRASVTEAMMQRRSSLATRAPPAAASSSVEGESEGEWAARRKTRRVSVVQMPTAKRGRRMMTVTAMVFFESRPVKPDVCTLAVALDKGLIQMWSHHSAGGCITNFLCIHMAGDHVSTMFTDPANKYLFTGTALGYIKVWLMENYGYPGCEQLHIVMPLLRLEFPFLWRDRVEGRAKRSLRDQKWPLLVNSYRGHLMAINQIEFLHEQKIVLTGSSDATARLWTLGGRYLGTLGSVLHEWNQVKQLTLNKEVEFRVPPDIELVASSTTMKVLKGGEVPRTHFKFEDDSDLLKDLPPALAEKATYGKRASSPVLGHYYNIPRNTLFETRYKIENLRGNVPVYRHLNCAELQEIKVPPPPESFAKRSIEMMQKAIRAQRAAAAAAGKASAGDANAIDDAPADPAASASDPSPAPANGNGNGNGNGNANGSANAPARGRSRHRVNSTVSGDVDVSGDVKSDVTAVTAVHFSSTLPSAAPSEFSP